MGILSVCLIIVFVFLPACSGSGGGDSNNQSSARTAKEIQLTSVPHSGLNSDNLRRGIENIATSLSGIGQHLEATIKFKNISGNKHKGGKK